MQLIYNANSGEIYNVISKSQDYNVYYMDFPQSFRDNLVSMSVNMDTLPQYLNKYHIVDGEIVEYEDFEINEIKMYGKILSESERLEYLLLEKLMSTHKEIQKAENTIEILELLSEVL